MDHLSVETDDMKRREHNSNGGSDADLSSNLPETAAMGASAGATLDTRETDDMKTEPARKINTLFSFKIHFFRFLQLYWIYLIFSFNKISYTVPKK